MFSFVGRMSNYAFYIHNWFGDQMNLIETEQIVIMLITFD